MPPALDVSVGRIHPGVVLGTPRELGLHVYDLVGYGDMISDRVRTDAYAHALRDAVTPDSLVLDIGTGTGLFALLACRFGARHVYAVEPSDAIAVARDIARANGYSSRITFIQKRSDRVQLPAPVDVIVSDIRGILPMCQTSLQSIVDARCRLLAPGGTLIPMRDRLMAAPVESQQLFDRYTRPWDSQTHDLDMTAARALVTNAWYKGRSRPDQLLAKAQCWATLDYTSLDSAAVAGEVSWIAERTGTVFGLSIWFDSELGAGAVLSNAPESPELIYGSAFFPLSEPVDVCAGDKIDACLRADPVGDDHVWSWTTTIRASKNPSEPKARFEQSTFYSMPMIRAQLHKRAASHRPELTEDGRIALLILDSMRKRQSLEDIAAQLFADFPDRFKTRHAAFDHACSFSGKYAETSTEEAPDELAPEIRASTLSRFSNG